MGQPVLQHCFISYFWFQFRHTLNKTYKRSLTSREHFSEYFLELVRHFLTERQNFPREKRNGKNTKHISNLYEGSRPPMATPEHWLGCSFRAEGQPRNYSTLTSPSRWLWLRLRFSLSFRAGAGGRKFEEEALEFVPTMLAIVLPLVIKFLQDNIEKHFAHIRAGLGGMSANYICVRNIAWRKGEKLILGLFPWQAMLRKYWSCAVMKEGAILAILPISFRDIWK